MSTLPPLRGSVDWRKPRASNSYAITAIANGNYTNMSGALLNYKQYILANARFNIMKLSIFICESYNERFYAQGIFVSETLKGYRPRNNEIIKTRSTIKK